MARRWAHPVRRTRHGWRVVKGSLAWHYLKRQRRFLLLLLVVLPLGGIAYIPVIGLTRAMVDQGIVEQTVPLSYYLWRIIGLAVLAGFFVFALSQTLSRVAYQLEYDLRTDLYHSIQTAEVRDLDTIAGGQLITRSLSDLQIVQSIMNLLPTALAFGPALLGIGVYLFILSPPLAIVTMLPIPITVTLLRRIRPKLAALSWAELNERAEVTSAVDEPVRGIRVVKAFGREEDERAKVAAVSLRVFRYAMTRARLARAVQPAAEGAACAHAGAAAVRGRAARVGRQHHARHVPHRVPARDVQHAAQRWARRHHQHLAVLPHRAGPPA